MNVNKTVQSSQFIQRQQLTHLVGHLHLRVGPLERLHVGRNRLRLHQFVHRAHRLGRAGHRAAQRNVGAHRLVLVANAGDLAGGGDGAGLLLAQLDQLLGENGAGALVAGGGSLFDFGGL